MKRTIVIVFVKLSLMATSNYEIDILNIHVKSTRKNIHFE